MRWVRTVAVPALLLAALAAPAGAVEKPGTAAPAAYVGVNKCRLCHLKEYRAWTATRHATALATLEKADAQAVAGMAARLKAKVKGPAARSPACLKCHVAGLGKGGYPGAEPALAAGLGAVTCEACHGPGSRHVVATRAEKKSTIRNEGTAAVCAPCHTPVMSPGFDFAAARKSGVHAVAAAGK